MKRVYLTYGRSASSGWSSNMQSELMTFAEFLLRKGYSVAVSRSIIRGLCGNRALKPRDWMIPECSKQIAECDVVYVLTTYPHGVNLDAICAHPEVQDARRRGKRVGFYVARGRDGYEQFCAMEKRRG